MLATHLNALAYIRLSRRRQTDKRCIDRLVFKPIILYLPTNFVINTTKPSICNTPMHKRWAIVVVCLMFHAQLECCCCCCTV